MTRIERSLTSVSWIPREAVVGVMRSAFSMGVAHYDQPPPDALTDLEEMRRTGVFRFANALRAWVDVEDDRIVAFGSTGRGYLSDTSLHVGAAAQTFRGQAYPELRSEQRLGEHAVRFVQTTGGRTGAPFPHRVRGRPYVTLLPPSVWTTLALTIHADGRHEEELVGASPFPRHWLYDNDGKLCRKVAVADFETWAATVFGDPTPWGGHELAASVIDVESALEHQLSVRVMDAQGAQRPSIRRLRAGDELVRQGEASKDVFLILNGLLTVEVDGETQMELGPGAIVGIRAALLGEGRRQATLRAVTPVTVAATSADLLAVEEMQQLVRQEDERTPRRDG